MDEQESGKELVITTTLVVTQTLSGDRPSDWGYATLVSAMQAEADHTPDEMYQSVIESIEMGPGDTRQLKISQDIKIQSRPEQEPLPGM